MYVEDMDLEEKHQYLDYLKRLMVEQNKAIANGDKYINKNWRMVTKLTIKQLTKPLYPDQVEPADEDHVYFNADPGEKPA